MSRSLSVAVSLGPLGFVGLFHEDRTEVLDGCEVLSLMPVGCAHQAQG